ncbi:MAG: GntR family transcriptional regulator [Aeromicrobium sp.]
MRSSSSGETNTRRVADLLRRDILDGDVAPGSRLRADAVAERFGVSRTPAREAFLLLAQEGLLEILPRRGAVVRPFDERDLYELYEVRALLEPLAARRATARITEADIDRLEELCVIQEAMGSTPDEVTRHLELNHEFHEIIVLAADSNRLSAALAQVEGMPIGFRTRFWRDDALRADSLMCHRALVSAMRARDGDYAETSMRLHHLAAMVLVREGNAAPDSTVKDEPDA